MIHSIGDSSNERILTTLSAFMAESKTTPPAAIGVVSFATAEDPVEGKETFCYEKNFSCRQGRRGMEDAHFTVYKKDRSFSAFVMVTR